MAWFGGDISIHAPQWGATRWLRLLRPAPRYFNPRTPVGCDWISRRGIGSGPEKFQSTHPSGVRLIRWCGQRRRDLFQSTHPSGVRRLNRQRSNETLLFQSTRPSGVRPLRFSRASMWGEDFNPRTPVGCDFALETFEAHGVQISIHAPQWGATRAADTVDESRIISIHAPQWGATI